jgi:hypothetical protein
LEHQQNNAPKGKRIVAPALNADSSMEDKMQTAIELFEALHGRPVTAQEIAEVRMHAAELQRKEQGNGLSSN